MLNQVNKNRDISVAQEALKGQAREDSGAEPLDITDAIKKDDYLDSGHSPHATEQPLSPLGSHLPATGISQPQAPEVLLTLLNQWAGPASHPTVPAIPDDIESAVSQRQLQISAAQSICAICSNVDRPSGDAIAQFLQHFEGVTAQEEDAAIYYMLPYAILRECDSMMGKISTNQANQADYDAFHLTCRAWNCLAHVLSDNPSWISDHARRNALRIEEALTKTQENYRCFPPTPHVPLISPQNPNMSSSRVCDTPPILMEMEDMPPPVRIFLDGLLAGGKKEASRHLLLKGPPGSGKTIIAQNIARLLGGVYFEPGEEFRNGVYGMSANGVDKFFKNAYQYALALNATAVILLDEIEALLPRRELMDSKDTERQTVISALLVQLNPDMKHFSHLVVVGATNLEKHIDQAILDRFDVVGIELPNCETLQRAIEVKLQRWGYDCDATQFQQLAELSRGMSQRAAVFALRKAPQGATFDVLRRILLNKRATMNNSISTTIYKRHPTGFIAHINFPAFTTAYNNNNTYHILAAADRIWSLEFHDNEEKRVGGIRLTLLDGTLIAPENLPFSITNNKATTFSSYLTSTGQVSPQSWYLPWQPLFQDVKIAPGRENFAYLFADDLLQVRLEVPIAPQLATAPNALGWQFHRIMLRKVSASEMSAGLTHPSYELQMQKNAMGNYSITALRLAAGVNLTVMLRSLQPPVRNWASFITSTGQPYLLRKAMLPLSLILAYVNEDLTLTNVALSPPGPVSSVEQEAQPAATTEIIDLAITES